MFMSASQKKIILLFFILYFFACFFAATDAFYGSEYGPSPFASLFLGSLQETVRTKAERSVFTYDSFLQIWNMYKLYCRNSILQVCRKNLLHPFTELSRATLAEAFFFLGSTGFLCVFQLLQTRFNVYILLYQSSRARLLLDAYQDTRSKRTPAQRVDSDTPPLTHRLLLSFFFSSFPVDTQRVGDSFL